MSQHTVQLPVGSVRQYWNKSCLPQIEMIRNNHCKVRTFSESTRGKNCSPQSSSSHDRSPFHIQWLYFKISLSQCKRNETSEALSSFSIMFHVHYLGILLRNYKHRCVCKQAWQDWSILPHHQDWSIEGKKKLFLFTTAYMCHRW